MSVRSRMRTAWAVVDQRLARFAARRGWMSSLYYALCNRSLHRGNRSILAGRLRYARDVSRPGPSSALLRRNIHRLEKGLLMRPRRECFAEQYIEETVEQYVRCRGANQASTIPQDEILWAGDVLSAYFQVCGDHERVVRARRVFEAERNIAASATNKRVPYQYSSKALPADTIEVLDALCEHRKSVRWFLPTPVPRDAIDRAIRLAGLAPSACNRQPFKFCVFDTPALVRKVARIPTGTAGYEHKIPVFIVVVGQMRHYFSERDRNLIYIDGSLAAMNFVLAAEAQGLSTCFVNWPGIESCERELTDFLGLEPDERPILGIALGFADPDGLVAFSARKPVPLLRKYNFE